MRIALLEDAARFGTAENTFAASGTLMNESTLQASGNSASTLISLDSALRQIRIDGTSDGDVVRVSTPSPNTVRVTYQGVETRDFSTEDVDRILFLGNAGNDRFRNSSSLVLVAFGHAGNDSIQGGSNNDYISGGSGNDKLEGSLGDDDLIGMAGDDLLLGGPGNDQIYGSNGDDRLRGQAGDDRMFGDAGNNHLDGGDGDDLMWGFDGSDYIQGGNGNDGLFGNGNDDRLLGGSGRDLIIAGAGKDFVRGHSGDDTILGEAGNDTLSGGDGYDVIIAGNGNDHVSGNAGNDKLFGNEGNDVIIGHAGDDQLYGDAGNDTLIGHSGNNRIFGNEGNDNIQAGRNSGSVFGGAGNDKIEGSPERDRIDGNNGNDVIKGGNGDDQIDGGAGNDTLSGGKGDDLLQGSSGNDSLHGDAGLDRLLGNEGDDKLLGGAGTDRLEGGPGIDELSGGSRNEKNFLIGGGQADRIIYFAKDILLDRNPSDLRIQLTTKGSSWNAVEIRTVNEAMKRLQAATGNSRLIKDNLTGRDLVFSKSTRLPQNAAAINEFDLRTWQREIRVAEWNEKNASRNHSQVLVFIHEIAHNWDSDLEMNAAPRVSAADWNAFKAISNWTQTNPASTRWRTSLDYQWYYHSSARFARSYGAINPGEDWATVWETHFNPFSTKPKSSSNLGRKLARLRAFFNKLKN